MLITVLEIDRQTLFFFYAGESDEQD